MTPEQERALALARARRRRQEAESQANPMSAREEYDASPWYQQIPQAADDIIRATANGLTFGFADKIAGALGGGGTEEQRALSGQARERAGGAYMAGEMAGGIRSALSLGNSGLTLMGRGAPAAMTGLPGVAARTGIAGVEGAGYGVLDALGNDRDVATGALMGAGFGAGGNLLGEGALAVANSLRGPQPRAQDLLAKQAAADSINPDVARALLDDLGPSGTIADLGPNLRRQASALATSPGQNQQIVHDAISSRSAGAGERISQTVSNAMGGPQNVVALSDDIVARRAGQAAPLYEVSRSVPVPQNEVLEELLSRPSAKSAIAQARRNVMDRGEVFDLAKPTVGLIDEIKKAIDDKIGAAVRSGGNARVSSLTELKNGIVRFADEVSPEYAQARQVFSSESAIKDALEQGVKAFDNNMTPDALAKYIGGLDDASREAYQIGARQKISNTMGTARNDASAVRGMFNKEYNAEKLRIILGNEGADEILRGLSSEQTFQTTANRILGGSDTVPKALAQETIASPSSKGGFFKNLLNVDLGDAATNLADSLIGGSLAARRERTNVELARLLMGSNPESVAPVAQNPAIRDAVTRALIGAYTGAN